jgi:hypothetical protein
LTPRLQAFQGIVCYRRFVTSKASAVRKEPIRISPYLYRALNFDVFWLENGMPEAMWVLKVEQFGPFIVTMDTQVRSRYGELRESAENIITSMPN